MSAINNDNQLSISSPSETLISFIGVKTFAEGTGFVEKVISLSVGKFLRNFTPLMDFKFFRAFFGLTILRELASLLLSFCNRRARDYCKNFDKNIKLMILR